jgi:hypothetical protein
MKTLSTLVVLFLLSFYISATAAISTPPAVTSPSDGASGVGLQPTISWSAATSDILATVEYKLTVATDANFNNIVYQSSAPHTNLSEQVSLLKINVEYFIKVEASDDGSSFTPSMVSDFKTVAPSNLRFDASDSKLKWDLSGVSVSSFDVELSLNSNFSTIAYQENVASNQSSNISGSVGTGTYYMRVRATNSAGTGEWKLQPSIMVP